MLHKGHINVAGQQRELDRAQFVESPTLSAAACGDRFVPYRRDLFAQWFVLDFHQAGKQACDLVYSVCHSQPLINTNGHE